MLAKVFVIYILIIPCKSTYILRKIAMFANNNGSTDEKCQD